MNHGEAPDMNPGLLATKLHRPASPPRQVQRPNLSRRLDQGLEAGRRLTLVSAPAGFGKTTCISAWVDDLDLPVAWLSLDTADDDPGRFFTYLVAALQRVDGDLGHEIEGILRAGEVPPGDVIGTTLLNDLLDHEGRFLLVLDDLQVIQHPSILGVLETLVTHLPPAPHLVLLTREDPSLPLAWLRANNQVTEIRAGDLRFSKADTARFLNEVMGLSLSQADIDLLETKTEGWIVGLQLAALALQSAPGGGQSDPSHLISTLSGSHRFILSYLTEQVLDRQPAETQRFLLQTSILDRLNGELCDAVTGRTGSGPLLEQLYRANLFLIPLDDTGHWYRYHQLFGGLLRDRLALVHQDRMPELHRRASLWYAGRRDEDSASIGQAIEHALAAKDYALAVDQLERHAMDALMLWHIKTVEGWMQAIPSEWTAQSSRVNLAFAWALMLRGNFPQAQPYLEQLQTIFASLEPGEEDRADKADWLALQVMLLNAQGQAREALALAQQALEMTPPEAGYTRSRIYMGLATAHQHLDDYGRGVDAYQSVIESGRASGDVVSETLGLSGLSLLALLHGQLQFAFDLAAQGVERIERSGSLPPLASALYGELGMVHYHWHQLDQAHSYFLRSMQVSTLSGYSDAELFYGVILARLYHMAGDLPAAGREIQRVADLMKVDAPARVREEVLAQQVRIQLAQDQPSEAERVLRDQGFSHQGKFSIPDPQDSVDRPTGLLYNSALRILLYRSRERQGPVDLGAGLDLADFLVSSALQRNYVPVALESLLLRAQVHEAMGNEAASLADYATALELGEPEGFVTIFLEGGRPVAQALRRLPKQGHLGTALVDYVKRLLDAFGELGPARAPSVPDPTPAGPDGPPLLITPLTERELDVLRLMANGLKYAEIADQLFISLNTVRFHVKAIYGKFHVNNRTRAIETARNLGLLDGQKP